MNRFKTFQKTASWIAVLILPVLALAITRSSYPVCCTTCNNANHYNVCVDSCSSCGSGTDPDYALCKKACENNCMPHFSPCY